MQRAVLELGNRLLSDLEGVSGSNITAKWMSWHLAEVMTAAETDSSRTEECAELILKLWRARQSLPSGDPFKRYDQVLSVLVAALESNSEPLIFGLRVHVSEDSDERDWASLVRSIRRDTHFLSLAAVDLAIEEKGLRRDDLVELAHEANPDVQTIVFRSIRDIGHTKDGKREVASAIDPITEALDSLQDSIDAYRNAYARARPITNES